MNVRFIETVAQVEMKLYLQIHDYYRKSSR